MSVVAKVAQFGLLVIPAGLLAAGVTEVSGSWGCGAAVMLAFIFGRMCK